VGVPVMALLLITGPLLLPEFRDPEARHVDLLSAGLSLCGVLSVTYAIKRSTLHGFGALSALLLLVGTALAVVFVRRQRRIENPLLDLALFRVPAFATSLATNTLCVFVIFGSFLGIAQYLQLVLGLSPLAAGLWTVPSSAGFIVGSLLAPLSLRVLRPEWALVVGLSLGVLGLCVLGFTTPSSAIAWVVVGSVLLALGLAPVMTLSTDRIVGFAAPERAGAASALSETGAELGGALGIAILGSLVAGMYRVRMAELALAGLPPAASFAARDTLSGAIAVAPQLPGVLASRLLERARAGFSEGMHWTAALSGLLLTFLVLLTARQARSTSVPSES
jgi:DHA2 family multidrug resistance protein-like MFS transporter